MLLGQGVVRLVRFASKGHGMWSWCLVRMRSTVSTAPARLSAKTRPAPRAGNSSPVSLISQDEMHFMLKGCAQRFVLSASVSGN